MRIRTLSILAAALVLPFAAHSATETEPPPNFVVIFIDDMGYGDIGPFGSKINQTPHLDRMAEEGMRLTSFYVAAPVCTPSRAALMTGCYPRRVGLAKGSGHVVLFPGDKHGLHPDEITIAEVLKEAGYATGCFGKWHLGDQPRFLPTAQGFDEYFGIPYSNDMWPGLKRWPFPRLPVMRGTEVVDIVEDMADQATLCRRFTGAAVEFIKKHKGKPFYESLLEFITSGPVVAMAVRGPRCIKVVRGLMGKTFGHEAAPGTLRGDFGLSTSMNIVHGSDSVENAARELSIFFTRSEILDYDHCRSAWSFGEEDLA